MNKIIVLFCLILSFSLVAQNCCKCCCHCQNSEQEEVEQDEQQQDIQQDEEVQSKFTKKEIKELQFLLEEEKLARDIYTVLYQEWDFRPFGNIRHSEQSHMDAIEGMLKSAGIKKPLKSDKVGAFQDKELKKLYKKLLKQGKSSFENAVRVGVFVEEKDIYDLEASIKSSKNDDMKLLLQNLNRASRNHMRAFVKHLQWNEISYESEYLSMEKIYAIAESDKEFDYIDDPDFEFTW